MNSIKNLHRLKRLHQLIRSECTGTPYELFKLAELDKGYKRLFIELHHLK